MKRSSALACAARRWRRKQAIEIDPMLAAAGWGGGRIEATEAIAEVRERPGRRQGPDLKAPTLPARGRSVRAAVKFLCRQSSLAGVSDQFFFGEKLEGSVPLRINSVPELAFNGRKHSDDRTHFMVVGCVINPFANCKFRHRELLLESSMQL